MSRLGPKRRTSGLSASLGVPVRPQPSPRGVPVRPQGGCLLREIACKHWLAAPWVTYAVKLRRKAAFTLHQTTYIIRRSA